MEVRIMSWNMAGAKLFEQLDLEPGPAAGSYISAFRKVWENSIVRWLATPDGDMPDIILLQECIGFDDCTCSTSSRWQSGNEILGEIFPGYECFFFPAVTSHNNPHPGKWNRYTDSDTIANPVPITIDIQQGYGICVRKGISIAKLWVPWANPEDIPTNADTADIERISCFEPISVSTGLYLGDRDTEPRMVIMGRVRLEYDGKHRYLNYLNIHLNTLKGEREGNVRLNRHANASRQQQIELILDNIVSAYQEATHYRIQESPEPNERDIWIMGGDFNTTPDSEEIATILRAGFVDTLKDKRIEDEDPSSALHNQVGTKWSLGDSECPPVVLDYIFCGIEKFTFTTNDLDTSASKRPFKPHFDSTTFETDHAVLFAKIKLQAL